ncbi:MAG: NAD(P)(+) transhydrogenase (Re/Si-specific) subunit beta [Cyclobacteriaceae bacterium]|mgnify:CR=1 FL=1|nr:NAD(P)(+) transhydrogenase (Re/Si-specific) subunit beta [Cyclobacteriaceae bacterium]
MIGILDIGYFVATISFIGGLKYMSTPGKAIKGNFIAATGMALAVGLTLAMGFLDRVPITNFLVLLGAITIGTMIGWLMSRRVRMTGMPQLVSFFNATGGGCAMLLGITEAQQSGIEIMTLNLQLLLASGLIIGGLSFTGSLIAYAKLAGKLKDRRGIYLRMASRVSLLVILLGVLLYSAGWLPLSFHHLVYYLAVLALLYGVLFVLPIGGADMPVVISLLNSLTGIATALTGLAYTNKIMMAGGIFVGAAGLLLTLMMCKAMNRSLFKVLSGKYANDHGGIANDDLHIKETSTTETAMQLAFARKIAVVPGYGLAVAQAQHVCSQLQKLLEKRDSVVHFIIHPVAGRMPGHMNVLLAEANISYNSLKEMDEVNDHMDQYDLVLVVGANDVVNPSAESDTNSPVYGMPIIRAYNSKQVVVMKRGMSTGYAGVVNSLFGSDNCHLLFGDAKLQMERIINELKVI